MKTVTSASNLTAKILNETSVLIPCRAVLMMGVANFHIIQKTSSGYREGYKLEDGGKVVLLTKHKNLADLKRAIAH